MRFRIHRQRYTAALAAAGLLLAAAGCSKGEDQQPPTQPAQRPAAPSSAPQAGHGDMNCDMSQDMSKMSAEEHRQMMERCQKREGSSPQSEKQPHEHPGG